MPKVLVQLREDRIPPRLEAVRDALGLSDDDIDAAYGIVPIDSASGLYTVRVEESARARIESALRDLGAGDDLEVGIFSDPRIEPFGPRNCNDVAGELGSPALAISEIQWLGELRCQVGRKVAAACVPTRSREGHSSRVLVWCPSLFVSATLEPRLRSLKPSWPDVWASNAAP